MHASQTGESPLRGLLGITTVVDRVIQQAIAQVLTPIYGKEFSDNSYGYVRWCEKSVGEIITYPLLDCQEVKA
ncbi:MAG TPA: hypothetical protein PLZ08_10345 [Bacillota bacterium]|nr:hypothetical protein [Bacillota bacterium]HOL10068.1 hypothetical protein [Bacillota bacterium]HPO98338.1 hypothetical protein [Bacillota bacterium]